MTDTPELDKQLKLVTSGRAPEVQSFIDWLIDERKYVLCEPVPDSLRGYYLPAFYGGPEQLMADYFGIDRDKIEAERRALLEDIRRSNEQDG